MITCKLLGGIGNQMFQIATIYSLSKENNAVCAFDLHNGVFTQKPAYVYKNNILSKIKEIELTNFKAEKEYKEPQFNYTKIPFERKNYILIGYFQSDRYFRKYKQDIFNLFIDENIINTLKEKYKIILNNSLSIHVRRGDYLNIQGFHPCPTIDYFKNAYSTIKNKSHIDNVLIFSDDINWCKQNFNFDNMTFIENQNDFEDLYLMSLCNHNIITNSSFSWWGSWLNKNENKIVVAPKKWFGEASHIQNWDDVYTKNMITI